ncbi:MAG: hypothetical protein E4H36_11895 [Spirochaetales bacterium]|nr:MAG: hypothetical protein E4H36_11895 [Spirochaetales bacterium]
MKRCALTFLIIFHSIFISLTLGADAMLSIESGMEIPVNPAPEWSPFIGISGGFDLYKAMSETLSLFLDGNGGIRFFPADNLLSSDIGVKGDFSVMKKGFVLRGGLGFSFDWPAAEISPVVNIMPELLLSCSLPDISFSISQGLIFRIYPSADWTWKGEAGFSILLAQQILLQPVFRFQKALGPAAEAETWLEGALEYSWYPGIPFIIDGNAGYRRVFSPDTYSEISFFEAGTISLGKPVQLVISVPCTLTLYDNVPITYYSVEPLASLDISFFKHGFVSLGAGPVFRMAPSDESAYASFYAALSFSLVF